MLWQEVREQYPHQFVYFKILKERKEQCYRYIDEVEVIRTVKDEDATKVLLSCKGEETLIYHTAHEQIQVQMLDMFRRPLWVTP